MASYRTKLEKYIGSTRVGHFVRNGVFAERRKTKFVVSSNMCFQNFDLGLGHRRTYHM
jgi:hypothetical protein